MDPSSSLNEYSRRFAELLFAMYPAWREHMVVEPWPNADSGCFCVEIASPAAPDQPLWIGTDGGEVTVGFGAHGWHDHFGEWTGADEATSFQQALDEVAAIIAGRRLLAVGFYEGIASVSQVYDANESPSFERVERIETFSWPGGCIGAIAT
jgi:hypothetical protein